MPINQHIMKNDYLMELNAQLENQPEVKSKAKIIFGNKINTLDKIIVSTLGPHANWLHQAINQWEDGEPISVDNYNKKEVDYSPSFRMSDGDGTVLAKSANINGVQSWPMFNANHNQIINSADGVLKIFHLLGLDFPDKESQPTIIKKVLLLVLHSPAEFDLTNNQGKKIGWQDKKSKTIIAVNPPDKLNLTVKGNNNIPGDSPYEISIMKVDKEQTNTYQFKGKINPNEERTFSLNTNTEEPFFNQNNYPNLILSLINKINQAEEKINNLENVHLFKKWLAKLYLKKAVRQVRYYQRNSYHHNKNQRLALATRFIFRSRKILNLFSKNTSQALIINNLLADSLNELSYLQIIANSHRYFPKQIKNKLVLTKKLLDRKNKNIQRLSNKGKQVFQYQVHTFIHAQSYLQQAQYAFSQKQYAKSSVFLNFSNLFLQEL